MGHYLCCLRLRRRLHFTLQLQRLKLKTCCDSQHFIHVRSGNDVGIEHAIVFEGLGHLGRPDFETENYRTGSCDSSTYREHALKLRPRRNLYKA